MRLLFGSLAICIVFFSVASGLLSNACKKRAEVCRGDSECCPVMGRRMVCAAHLEICGKKICCITEVEEQQEKQAALLRNRNRSLKRFIGALLNED
ncbi:unnamed protein product [Adineta ricciae]|uniref:Uncharacterized protein n=1 Tax=Adineta ricciae TaxID=249248 RepID=A0A814QEQ2_ADIRI|nr:unnamed protein product [Adineta ricciae]CAF1544730.1 unnamed protein product [Adineta ricciae]